MLQDIIATCLITVVCMVLPLRGDTPTTPAHVIYTHNAPGIVSDSSLAMTQATGTWTCTTQPEDGSAVVLGVKTYTFKASPSSADQVLIGADNAASMQNLAYAINLTGTPGTNYGSATTVNLDATASVSGTILTAISKGFGAAASGTIATTTTVTGASWGAGTLDGSSNGTPGTDDYTALQAIYTQAATQPTLVIVDGKYATSHKIVVSSGTKTLALKDCGVIATDGSNDYLFENSHYLPLGALIDHDISFEGGIWNGNGTTQPYNPKTGLGPVAFHLSGVRNLTMDHMKLENAGTFAVLAGNLSNYRMSDLNILQACCTSTGFNQDGIDIIGPATNGLIRNLIYRGNDDGIAVYSDNLIHGPLFRISNGSGGWGPVTDLLIDGYVVDNPQVGVKIGTGYSHGGIRLCSGTQLMDKVTINHVRGTTFTGGISGSGIVYIDNFPTFTQFLSNPGPGNFGKITINDCNVENYGPAGAFLAENGVVSSLDLTNFCENTSLLGLPIMTTGPNTNINSMRLTGSWLIKSPVGVGGGIVFSAGSTWGKLEITDFKAQGNTMYEAGPFISVTAPSGANKQKIQMSNSSAVNYASILKAMTSGTIAIELSNVGYYGAANPVVFAGTGTTINFSPSAIQSNGATLSGGPGKINYKNRP